MKDQLRESAMKNIYENNIVPERKTIEFVNSSKEFTTKTLAFILVIQAIESSLKRSGRTELLMNSDIPSDEIDKILSNRKEVQRIATKESVYFFGKEREQEFALELRKNV